MATLKRRLYRKNSSGTYDIVYLETSADLITGTVAIANGGTGNTTGLAASATKLATARTVRTNLASTSTASFNGTANITPGVTGILSVANGGTGVTSIGALKDSLGISSLSSDSIGDVKIAYKKPTNGTWLECDGSKYNTTTYSELFNLIKQNKTMLNTPVDHKLSYVNNSDNIGMDVLSPWSCIAIDNYLFIYKSHNLTVYDNTTHTEKTYTLEVNHNICIIKKINNAYYIFAAYNQSAATMVEIHKTTNPMSTLTKINNGLYLSTDVSAYNIDLLDVCYYNNTYYFYLGQKTGSYNGDGYFNVTKTTSLENSSLPRATRVYGKNDVRYIGSATYGQNLFLIVASANDGRNLDLIKMTPSADGGLTSNGTGMTTYTLYTGNGTYNSNTQLKRISDNGYPAVYVYDKYCYIVASFRENKYIFLGRIELDDTSPSLSNNYAEIPFENDINDKRFVTYIGYDVNAVYFTIGKKWYAYTGGTNINYVDDIAYSFTTNSTTNYAFNMYINYPYEYTLLAVDSTRNLTLKIVSRSMLPKINLDVPAYIKAK